MKKSKNKNYAQAVIRLAFFAREAKKKVIDGTVSQLSKPPADKAYHVREPFVRIFNIIRDEFLELRDDNYLGHIKTLIGEFKKLNNEYVKLGGKGKFADDTTDNKKVTFHDAISNQLNKPLAPLEKFLKQNFKYSIFDRKYCKDDDRKIHKYKLKAVQTDWCQDYQTLLDVLYKYGYNYPPGEQARENDEGALEKVYPKLFGVFEDPQIDSERIIEKLDYKGWHNKENFVEWCFLQPLTDAFKLLRKDMFVLYMQGKNLWRQPLDKNMKLTADSIDLIKKEIRAEILLGNHLARDQLNFLYKVIGSIYDCPPAQELLLKIQDPLKKTNEQIIKESKEKKRDPTQGLLQITIPRLTILYTFEQMRRITVTKRSKEVEDALRTKRLMEEAELANLNKPKEKEQPKESGEEVKPAKKPSPSPYTKRGRSNSKKNVVEEVKEEVDPDDEEAKVFGRYWMWKDFLGSEENNYMEKRDELHLGEDFFRKINTAVIQDIEDYLIRKGIGEKIKNYDDVMKTITKEEKEELPEDYHADIRPPLMWNHPVPLTTRHTYRDISRPKQCYEDGRVEQFLDLISKMGHDLLKTHAQEWNYLVYNVVDVYKKKKEEELKAEMEEEDM